MSRELRGALEGLDSDVVKEGFCLLYDDIMSGENPVHRVEAPVAREPEIPNFVSLILHMKQKYSFDELNDIHVEGGRVVFKRGGRRIELSREEQEVLEPQASPSGEATEQTPRFRQLEMN